MAHPSFFHMMGCIFTLLYVGVKTMGHVEYRTSHSIVCASIGISCSNASKLKGIQAPHSPKIHTHTQSIKSHKYGGRLKKALACMQHHSQSAAPDGTEHCRPFCTVRLTQTLPETWDALKRQREIEDRACRHGHQTAAHPSHIAHHTSKEAKV